jgi:hypothetical protein
VGDLNYRINCPKGQEAKLFEDCEKAKASGEWGDILARDQLLIEHKEGRVFEDWHEGIPTFCSLHIIGFILQ